MEDLRESDSPIRVRWAVGLLAAAAVLISGQTQTIFCDGLGLEAIRPITILMIFLGLVLGLLGLIVVAPLLQHPERTDSPRPFVLTALCGLAVLAAATLLTLPFLALVILIVIAATQLRLVSRGAPVPPPASRLRLALPYSVVVLVMVPVGVLHRLSGVVTWMLIVWAAVGGVAAIVFPVLCRLQLPALAGPPRRTVCAGLIMVAVVGYGHWLTGIGLVASTAPGGTIIAIAAQLATVLALFIGAPAWRRATVGS